MSEKLITPGEFNEEFTKLLTRAGKAQIPLGFIVQTLEISKTQMIMNQIEIARQAQAMEFAQKMAQQAGENQQKIIQ